jgi:hypothetical protein
MLATCGTSTFTPATIASAALTEHIYWLDPREFMMPTLGNAFQGAVSTQLSPRSLTKSLGIAVVLATIVATIASIWLPYTHGGGVSLNNPFMYIYAPGLPFSWALDKAGDPHPASAFAIGHIVAGAIIMLLLVGARLVLPSTMAVHPAGFLVADTYAIGHLWFSIFLAWAIKVPVLRYGGVKLYGALRPFFLGLILGDCLNAIVWTIVGMATGAGYQLMPG